MASCYHFGQYKYRTFPSSQNVLWNISTLLDEFCSYTNIHTHRVDIILYILFCSLFFSPNRKTVNLVWSTCYLMPGKILNRVDNQNFSKLKLLISDFRDNCNISLMHVPTLIKKNPFLEIVHLALDMLRKKIQEILRLVYYAYHKYTHIIFLFCNRASDLFVYTHYSVDQHCPKW